MSNTYPPSPETRAWVEVDLDALRANFRTVREVVPRGTAVIVMIKANAYGVGAERAVRALAPLSPWGYGVATADEGAALRRAGVTEPIIVFGPLPPEAVQTAEQAGLTASISDLGGLERWAAAAEKHGSLDFHVEIDTGMGRSGFDWRETPIWGERVRSQVRPWLRWTGVFTHFQGADAPERAPTQTQWERFQDALVQLPVSREDLLIHAANSAATLRWPEYGADAVRPGIFLYGGHPAPNARPGELPSPLPVVSVRSRIVLVRDVPPGSTVGYGATHVARGWERWGTLAIGYGDGLPRAVGGKASAIVRGRRVPLLGRISMDLTTVDLTGMPDVGVGEVATLIGRDGEEEILLDDVARQANTIGYEILAGLTPRLPRIEYGEAVS